MADTRRMDEEMRRKERNVDRYFSHYCKYLPQTLDRVEENKEKQGGRVAVRNVERES